MRALAIVLATYLVVVVQTAVCPSLAVAGATPDLLALEAQCVVLLSASPYSFLWAGWLGLIHDLASDGRLGVAMSGFALVGYVVGRARQQLYVRHPLVLGPLAVVGVAASLGLVASTRALLRESSLAWNELARAVVGGAAYSGMVALPVLLAGWRQWRVKSAAS